MKNFGKQQKQFTQFTQGTGFGKQTTVGFYTQKFHTGLLARGVPPRNRCQTMCLT